MPNQAKAEIRTQLRNRLPPYLFTNLVSYQQDLLESRAAHPKLSQQQTTVKQISMEAAGNKVAYP